VAEVDAQFVGEQHPTLLGHDESNFLNPLVRREHLQKPLGVKRPAGARDGDDDAHVHPTFHGSMAKAKGVA
jgi:hypothetical protein